MDSALAEFNEDQAQGLERDAFLPLVWRSQWERFFLAATAVLATTILLKVVAIQWLELLYLFQIMLIALNFIRRDLRATGFGPFLWLGFLYFLFMAAAMGLAVASFRFTFYYPPGIPWFIYPGWVTFSRIVELFASTFILLWLADLFRRETNKLRFTMRIYFWTGVVSAVYSYLSYFLDISTGEQRYGSYLINHRFRGFYNEGGPWGLYLFTVIFVGLALYSLHWEPVMRMRIGLALLPIAFYKSYSKAAFSAVLVLLLINGLFTSGIAKRVLILASFAVIFTIGARNFDLGQALSITSNDDSYERLSHIRYGDPNFVYGRLAARFIVPRMIAAHPYTGIGWGNYGILRNDPRYRGASYFTTIADQPGLGALGYAAELGLPLLAFLGFLLLLPYFYLRWHRAPTWMTNLALMSPLVHIFGAQLNVTYPWVVTAFALGLGFATANTQKLQPAEAPLQLSWEGRDAEAGTETST